MNSALIIFCSIALVVIVTCGAASAQIPVSSGKQSVITTTEELVDRYFDSLNELDDKRRRDLTRRVWAEKGKFGTPYGEVEGLGAIDALVAGVHTKFPKATVRRTTKIDGFGNYLRWSSRYPALTEYRS